MNKILTSLDKNLIDAQTSLEHTAFNPALEPVAGPNPDLALDHLIDEHQEFTARRKVLEERIAALEAIRPLLIAAIEATEREQARQEAEAQRAIDAARIKELMAELATMEPGPRQSLLLVEISKLRGEL